MTGPRLCYTEKDERCDICANGMVVHLLARGWSAMTGSTASEHVLVIIPAYNEEGAVHEVVCGVRQVLPAADVLVIDDGSSDGTAYQAHLAGASVIRHPFNMGIGATVQTGLKHACNEGYDVVIRLDGDGQHSHEDIPKLYAALLEHKVDAVFGSRFMGGDSTMNIPFSRRVGILCFACLVTALTRQRATDTTSGFCCLNRRAINVLASYTPQDYPEVEGRVILHKAKLLTAEIPAHMRARQAGVSSIDSWRSLYYALKVTVAVLITALKDIPVLPKEFGHVDTSQPATFGRYFQPALVPGDRSTDSPAKAP
jgi:glycosyltransferase involved in cell wall biosynthesis